MIQIKNLHTKINEKPILNGLDLSIGNGEVHAIMGPNGAGKSTLGNVIAGKEGYDITDGEILFQGKDLLDLETDERARAGIFLAFQYPVEIPGISCTQFLRESVNAIRKGRGQDDLNAAQFLKLIRAKAAELKMDPAFLKRNVNVGFSGGEKKRFEILQMSLLEPTFCVLDETDSGLDIDALKIVAEGVNNLRDGKRSFLVITHYQRLLDYIQPDHVHILANGQIVQSGGPELAKELEDKGYDGLGIPTQRSEAA